MILHMMELLVIELEEKEHSVEFVASCNRDLDHVDVSFHRKPDGDYQQELFDKSDFLSEDQMGEILNERLKQIRDDK